MAGSPGYDRQASENMSCCLPAIKQFSHLTISQQNNSDLQSAHNQISDFLHRLVQLILFLGFLYFQKCGYDYRDDQEYAQDDIKIFVLRAHFKQCQSDESQHREKDAAEYSHAKSNQYQFAAVLLPVIGRRGESRQKLGTDDDRVLGAFFEQGLDLALENQTDKSPERDGGLSLYHRLVSIGLDLDFRVAHKMQFTRIRAWQLINFQLSIVNCQ